MSFEEQVRKTVQIYKDILSRETKHSLSWPTCRHYLGRLKFCDKQSSYLTVYKTINGAIGDVSFCREHHKVRFDRLGFFGPNTIADFSTFCLVKMRKEAKCA